MTGEGRFAYLARKVPAEVADQIEALGLAGVAFLDDSERYLPAGTSARSLLGAVDVDNKGIVRARVAVRRAAHRARPASSPSSRTPRATPSPWASTTSCPPVPGQNLMLTVDRAIQYEAETAPRRPGGGRRQAKGGIAIVTKPGTGEVLAMANVVTDPDTGEVVVGDQQRRRSPPSTSRVRCMKPVTVAAALEDGHGRRPTRPFYLPPTLQIYDDEFGEAERHGDGDLDRRQDPRAVVEHRHHQDRPDARQASVACTLPSRPSASGSGPPSTSRTRPRAAVLEPSKWSGTSLPTIAIGQGISVTPAADARGLQHHRQPAACTCPRSWCSPPRTPTGIVHPTVTDRGPPGRSAQATADQLNLMLRSVVERGHRPAGQDPRLRRRSARPAPPARSSPVAATPMRTASPSTSPPSSASSRPSSRPSRCT